MIAADRTSDPDEAIMLAEQAAEHAGAGVVAFGLANDEDGFPPEPFDKAFAIAVEAGLISAPHAGELAGAPSVRGALDFLHARRIGHRSAGDPGQPRRGRCRRVAGRDTVIREPYAKGETDAWGETRLRSYGRVVNKTRGLILSQGRNASVCSRNIANLGSASGSADLDRSAHARACH